MLATVDKTVPTSVKGRTCDHKIWLEVHQRLPDGLKGDVLAFVNVVVATNYCANNLALITQQLLQRSTRSNGSLRHINSCIGLLFAPYASEELVQVMDYSNGIRRVSAPSCSCAPLQLLHGIAQKSAEDRPRMRNP